jgi:hypothetical protein
VKDLSTLAVDSMWVTSQEGGNLIHDNSGAMTAPGTRPATPMPPEVEQSDPNVALGPQIAVGAPARHPQPSTSFSPTSVTWKDLDNG